MTGRAPGLRVARRAAARVGRRCSRASSAGAPRTEVPGAPARGRMIGAGARESVEGRDRRPDVDDRSGCPLGRRGERAPGLVPATGTSVRSPVEPPSWRGQAARGHLPALQEEGRRFARRRCMVGADGEIPLADPTTLLGRRRCDYALDVSEHGWITTSQAGLLGLEDELPQTIEWRLQF